MREQVSDLVPLPFLSTCGASDRDVILNGAKRSEESPRSFHRTGILRLRLRMTTAKRTVFTVFMGLFLLCKAKELCLVKIIPGSFAFAQNDSGSMRSKNQ